MFLEILQIINVAKMDISFVMNVLATGRDLVEGTDISLVPPATTYGDLLLIASDNNTLKGTTYTTL